MPRPREYDPNRVIDQVIDLIRDKGYFDTSIDDVTSVTGINRHSLYANYGNKRGLFMAALARYQETVLGPIIAPLTEPDASVPAILSTFDRLARWARSPEGRSGCLICGAAVEIAPHDKEIAKHLETLFDGLRDAFAKVLRHAQTAGDLPPNVAPSEYATYLIGVFQGYMALVKGPLPATAADTYLKVSLTSLGQPIPQ